MHITILNLKQTLFDGEAQGITAPGSEGEFTILSNHVPMLTSLKKGVIILYGKTEKKYVEVPSRGVCEFNNNTANILVGEVTEGL